MRRKKNSALAVKFVPKGGYRTFGTGRLDAITNMEGALHTFVTPVVGKCEMTGDYRYNTAFGGHGVTAFGNVVPEGGDGTRKVRLTRTVVMSASIQMDFEGTRVMLRVCRLDSEPCVGVDLLRDPDWKILSVDDKQEDHKRDRYDELLRRHMVYHLTRDGRLPARRTVRDALQYDAAVSFLELLIASGVDMTERVVGKYVTLHNEHIVSLELLFNTALHQVRNEFSALEALCSGGYVYTYDPASIFAQEIGASLLNRLMLSGLRCISDLSSLPNMRIFAFNNYADRGILDLVSKALVAQKHVQVVAKADLFRGNDGQYEIGRYEKAIGAMLVVHNNSDAFGQNIETEGDGGSLDGAIGSNSSAAASLAREREDLLDNVL